MKDELTYYVSIRRKVKDRSRAFDLDEVTNWCDKHIGQFCIDWYYWRVETWLVPGEKATYNFQFYLKEDAMLFKLTWG